MPLQDGEATTIKHLNWLAQETPRYWDNVRYDIFTTTGAIEYLKLKKPRVLYVSVGETDDWSHDGRYDLYLDAAHRTDRFLKQIWETVQSLPEYRDKTAIVLATDHGRGAGREGWKSHGVIYPGSDRIWIAAWGTGVPARGIRENINVTQSQVAATVARLLALDFQDSGNGIAPPLPLFQDANR